MNDGYRVISALQLDSYFDFIITSKEHGYLKPARELWDEALRRAEVTGNVIFVNF
jgi:FMN phosphatase YigB (HAD superfamily)